MKIYLANPRGFCAGVDMAIECVEQALEIVGSPLYVYHEIVHNRHVVERFVKDGVIFVDHIDEVPADSTVIFSAHGVSPQVRNAAKTRGCTMIDATCPLVTKVHTEAKKYAARGYHILLIGDSTTHQEVIGTLGEAPDQTTVVSVLHNRKHDPELADRVVLDPAFEDWPLVVLTDDAERATRSKHSA